MKAKQEKKAAKEIKNKQVEDTGEVEAAIQVVSITCVISHIGQDSSGQARHDKLENCY